MTDQLKQDATVRLAKISGQVNGLRKMVEGGRSCPEVLQQIASARAALEQLSVHLLGEHLQVCVLHQVDGGEAAGCCPELPAEAQTAAIKGALKRFLR